MVRDYRCDVEREYRGASPGPEPTQPEMANRILHARFELGGTAVMASDGPIDQVQPMRSAYLTLSSDTDEETEELYHALAQGGEIFMSLQETFYATRFAMLRDQFGINWMLIHERPMPAQA